MTTLSQILQHKVVAIIRGVQPEDVLHIVEALTEGGIKLVEVTLNSPNPLSAITQLRKRFGTELLVGAGTVLDAPSAKAAIAAGAQFIISPSLDVETIKETKRGGAVSIPGAFTATEILTAYKCGGDIIKVFPSTIGPAYFKDLHGPFPHIPLMPTGGVNIENIAEFQKAGAVAFGVGSGLIGSSPLISDAYLKSVTQHAKKFIMAISSTKTLSH